MSHWPGPRVPVDVPGCGPGKQQQAIEWLSFSPNIFLGHLVHFDAETVRIGSKSIGSKSF